MSILLDLAKNLAIQRGIGSLQKRIDSYFGGDDDRTDDFVSQQKTGGLGSVIGRALAYALLGPIAGPIAFSAGKGLLSKQQGLGFSSFGGEDKGPSGIVSGKVQTLDGKIVDAGSEEAKADMNRRDKEFQETGDYDVYSGTTVSTGRSQPSFDPNADYYTGSDEEDRDNESSGGGGSSSASTAGDAPGYSGPSPFRYGGLASLYR
tara:strand:+ start:231 stop:845 length:615 start_codon:yes stop_codon:yes gene_type:complete